MTDVPFSGIQAQLLSRVVDVLVETFDWPTRHWVDYVVDRELSSDSEQLLADAPRSLVSQDQLQRNPQSKVALTVEGVSLLPDCHELAGLFVRLLRVCVEHEQAHRPATPRDVGLPTLEAGQAMTALSALGAPPTPDLLRAAVELGTIDGVFASSSRPLESPGGWSLSLGRDLRAFRGVSTLEQYIQTRERARPGSTWAFRQVEKSEPSPRRQPRGPLLEPQAASLVDHLHNQSGEVSDVLDQLLSVSTLADTNAGDSGFTVITGTPWYFKPLPREHQALLGKAREVVREWIVEGRRLVSVAAGERLDSFDDATRTLARIVDREDVSTGPISALRVTIPDRISKALEILDHLPSSQQEASRMLVPDTNALLRRPDIENWDLRGEDWTLVLVHDVVREIDEKKMNQQLGGRAESLIRRFNEYGRRGDTLREGVPLAGRLRFREVASSPDFRLLPNMFDPGLVDDRILAGALMLRLHHPTSLVAIVTRDRNMRNRARLAGLPSISADEL